MLIKICKQLRKIRDLSKFYTEIIYMKNREIHRLKIHGVYAS